jgi:hypothetical protein
MATESMNRTRPAAEPTVAELVRRASDDLSRLVRDELQLAKLELASKGKEAGVGAGLLGGGAGFAFFGVAALVTTAILGLATVLDPWLSALLVGLALLAVAGVLALIGVKRLKRSVPPVPEEAMASVQADIDRIKGSVRR